jgi:hypothetical protein
MERKDLKKYEAPMAEVVCADFDVELLQGSVTIEQPEFAREPNDDLLIMETLGIKEFNF